MEERLFPLPIVSPSLRKHPFLLEERGETDVFAGYVSLRFRFFDYCYFYWNTQREPLQRREQLPDDTCDECFARSITL